MFQYEVRIPVCTLSLEAALENSAAFWMASRYCNLQCRDVIEQTASRSPDALHLRTDQGKALLLAYGIDRLMWVTTCAVLHAGVSPEWAKNAVTPDYPLSEAAEWCVRGSIPALLAFGEELAEYAAGFDLIQASDCASTVGSQDLCGQLLVLDPKVLDDAHKDKQFQLVLAVEAEQGSFYISGISLSDGQKVTLRRTSFLGVLAPTETAAA